MHAKVRTATLEDIPALERLMKESMRELSRGYYDDAQTESAVQYIAVPDPEIVSDGTYFVVEAEGQLAGCGGWSRRRKLFTGTSDQEGLAGRWLDPAREPARIRAMFVDPAFARRGIGLLIYQACEEAARAAGFTRFELMATLPGVPFYRHLGFKVLEELDLTLPDGTVVGGAKMQIHL